MGNVELLINLDFTDCNQLREINISFSRLNYLDKNLMRSFDSLQLRTGNLTVDLTGNPFHCYCHENHTSIMYWIRHTDVTIAKMEQLTCYGPFEEEFIKEKNWKLQEELCSFWDEFILAISVTLITTSALFILIGLIYKLCQEQIQTNYIFLQA